MLILNGHEVQYFGDAIGSNETGKENVGIGQVELLAVGVLSRPETEVAASLVIQDRSEDTGRVESGQAKPIYSRVRADQSCGVKVTYEPVIFYWEVAHVRSRRCRVYRSAYILPHLTMIGKGHRQVRDCLETPRM